MSKKTMGDYLRMMIDTEHNPDEEDSETPEETPEKVSESRPVIRGMSFSQYENNKFSKYVEGKIASLSSIIENDVNNIIDKDGEYTLIEYIILGVTLEHGLIAVLKCLDESERHVNFHIEIGDEGATFKGEV